MPKMVRFHELGGPEKLKLEELPACEPGEGEAKLRVEAVGLNRAESLYMRGQYFEQPRLPSGIGYEAAGMVEAVGQKVDTSWIGRRAATVPGFSMNDYAVLGEEAIVPATSLAEYPKSLSAVEGAASWMQYLTAYGPLVQLGKVQSGEYVLISAASSSVGVAAIQIVKAEGGVSIATTRTSKKRKAIEELGADHVIATEEEDVVDAVKRITSDKGVRIVFDAVGGPFVEKLAQTAVEGGILFEYGNLSMQPTPLPMIDAIRKSLTIRGYSLREMRRDPQGLEAAKRYIFERLEDGRFVPKVAKTFPLASFAEAYRYLESNAQVGKVVITV